MRTASEVLRSLEQRIAHLEGQSFRSASSSYEDISAALKMLQEAGFKLVKGISGTYTFSYKGAEVKFTESDVSYLDEVKSFLKQVRNVEVSVKVKMGMGTISQSDLSRGFKNQFGRMKGANMIYKLLRALLEHNGVRVASDAFSSKRNASLTAHNRLAAGVSGDLTVIKKVSQFLEILNRNRPRSSQLIESDVDQMHIINEVDDDRGWMLGQVIMSTHGYGDFYFMVIFDDFDKIGFIDPRVFTDLRKCNVAFKDFIAYED